MGDTSRRWNTLFCYKINANTGNSTFAEVSVTGKATSAATVSGDGATTLTTKGYVDGGDWVTVTPNISDIAASSSIAYRVAGKTVEWKMKIYGDTILTNGDVYCTVPEAVRPPHPLVFQLMPEFSGTNVNGTFVTVAIKDNGSMMQLSNDKPSTAASQQATINNSLTSSLGPPIASGAFSYPID